MHSSELAERGYYFALPRVWAFFSGRDAQRSENNSIEAYFAGLAVFLISYATLLAQFHSTVLVGAALLFVTWLAWLAVFYLNALLINALRSAGIFSARTNSSAQNILVGIETTGCAITLTMHSHWRMLGWVWLLIVTANAAAAVVLRLAKQRDA